MTVLLIDLFYNITAAQYHDLSMYLHLIWIAAVILITYALFPTVCGWLSFQCFILKVSVFSALEVLSWLLEMERLCSRVHLMQGWKLFSARNCQRYLLTLAISFYHVTAELLSSVHAQWSFFYKKKLISFQLYALFITGLVSFL